MPLNWQTLAFPFGTGLNTLADKRAVPPTELAVCRDVQFKPGGLETRLPYQSIGADALSDVRKVVTCGDELLCFTKDSLYSWSARDSSWVLKGTHMAVAIEDRSVFQRTADQSGCDRAELDNCVVYAWYDKAATSSVFVAAADKTTGAVTLPPTVVRAGTSSRPRLIAIGTHILLFFADSTAPSLRALAIDPANLAGSVAASSVTIATGTAFSLYYDLALIPDSDGAGLPAVFLAYRRNTTTSYTVRRVYENLTSETGTFARDCDGPIAVSVTPDSQYVQIVRSHGTAIVGDLLALPAMTDVFTGQDLGVVDDLVGVYVVNQIAAAHSDVKEDGQYRCHYFFSANETSGVAEEFSTGHGWVNTAGTIGTPDGVGSALGAFPWIFQVGVASRAFAYDGHVYVWLVFAGDNSVGSGYDGTLEGFRSGLQNTYLLYRDDKLLVSKAAPGNAGGFVASIGHLPGVQDIGAGVFSWAGAKRRVVSKTSEPTGGFSLPGFTVNGTHGYEARTPSDITIAFDSNDARRAAKFGETLYVSGGLLTQYDGTSLAEVGFTIYPRFVGLDYNATGAKAHSPSPGEYSYLSTFSWRNAAGELERSTTDMEAQITFSGSGSTDVAVETCQVTNKELAGAVVSIEVWATAINPSDESPLFLVTDIDPSNLSGNNCHIANDVTLHETGVNDADNDTVVTTFQGYPEVGTVLPNTAPPGSRVIYATHDRIFLAGIPGRPNTVVYSRLRGAGEIASFSAFLTVDVPAVGGDITGLSFLDETLIVFRETAIYALPGVGYDNIGGGQNYGPPRRVGGDVGAVSAETIAITPMGLFFKSRKGWHLLGSGGAPEYVGAMVAGFDDDEVLAVNVVEDRQEIRCITDSRVIVFDYRARQWAEWTIADGISAAIWQGRYHYLASGGTVMAEQDDYSTGVSYGIDVESAWMNFGQMQGYGAVREMAFLGEFRSAFRLRVRVAYSYGDSEAAPTWVDDKVIDTTPTVVGGPFQLIHGPKRHKAQSFKVRLTACSTLSLAPPTGEALKLTAMTFELGLKRGLHKRLPATQKS